MSTEELRQNVFSSIHMSTLAKNTQASITYPSCTFCGGTLITTSSKGSPKRKSSLYQLTLYTNSSESFVVWYKKQEEPKGLLWMRSCCVRKGQEEKTVELISRSCRGRCSYTLKFSSNHASEEWYKLLKQESRKIPCLGDELPCGGAMEETYDDSLDSMLTDISPLSVLNEVLHGQEEALDQLPPLVVSSPVISPTKPSKVKTPKVKSVKQKLKSNPVICNPLQGLSSKNKKVPVIPLSSSFSSSYVSSVHPPLNGIENTPPSDSDQLNRWSWPMKVGQV